MAIALDNAYNYYVSTYGQSLTPSRYDTHKKSDLRNVYNSMLKLNKDAPLYKIANPNQAQRFAIDMKESSRQIQNVLSSISEDFDDGEDEGSFKKRIAYSSDESKVVVNYINEDDDESQVDDFEIDVRRLARPQINTGAFLNNKELSLPTGEYSFDLSANQTVFEFQFTVRPEDTNFSINSRLAQLVNSANLGLTAAVVENGQDQSALKIVSQQTGLMPNEDSLFSIRPNLSKNSALAMRTLHLDNVTQEAANSTFLLNGTEHSSYSNSFTINKAFELSLLGTTDEPVTVGFKSDTEAIAENVRKMTDAYNSMVSVAQKYSGINIPMNKLSNLIEGIRSRYEDELLPIGLEMDDTGAVTIDKALLTEASEPSNWSDTNSRLDSFKNTISRLAWRTSLDPMDFVDKKICAYKNPGHNYNAPYATSRYAGMLFDATR